MPEPVIAAQFPNDHLTRKQLRKTGAGDRSLAFLLEQLCTDSIFSIKDEFEDGISANKWQSRGFVWEPEEFQGVISTLRVDDEDEALGGDSWIASRVFGWRGSHRPVVIARMRTDFSSGKFEFGFTSDVVDSGLGIVTSKANVTANSRVRDFAVGCMDRNDDTSIDLLADGRTVSLAQATPTTATSIGDLADNFSIMLTLNEQGESRLWINGIHTTVLRTGPASYVDLGLWIQSRASLYIDYIQAWQERVAI